MKRRRAAMDAHEGSLSDERLFARWRFGLNRLRVQEWTLENARNQMREAILANVELRHPAGIAPMLRDVAGCINADELGEAIGVLDELIADERKSRQLNRRR